jgi:hypothetical protein
MLISALFKVPWKRSARKIAGKSDRRENERYEAYHPVTIRIPGMPPVAGTLISISLGGAAIRFHGWIAEVPEAWLTDLKPGDELRLDGLVGVPMPCRTVTTAGGVLRVQFGQDDRLRHKLRSMVNDFTGTYSTARRSDRHRTTRSMTDRSAVELREQAAKYRELAKSVRTEAAVTSLMRLAEAFEGLAERREKQD